MLQLNAQSKIYLCVEAVDFRKGIDGLAALCRQRLRQDPFCGGMYVFRNRRGHCLRILCYDGQGFWLCSKRLSRGKFAGWPLNQESSLRFSVKELQILLWNGDPTSTRFQSDWKKLPE